MLSPLALRFEHPAHTVLVCSALLGCAPTLSTFTPAHVPAAKHVRLEMGTDVSIPGSGLDELVDIGTEVAGEISTSGLEVGAESQERLLEATMATMLNPPSLNTHAGIGLGIGYGSELSLRAVSGGTRLGARMQFLTQDQQGIDLSAGLGLSRVTFGFELPNLLSDYVSFDDYTRQELDLVVLAGGRGSWYRWWGGPRALFSRYHARLGLTLPEHSEVSVALDGTGTYLGALLGGALGYKAVFVAAELTVVSFSTTAQFGMTDTGLDDFETGVQSPIIYPSLGLLGEF